MAHNIISGQVLNSANNTEVVTETMPTPRRNVPNWLKAVYAFFLAVVAIVALSLIFGPKGDTLPACKFEDGSGQSACYWDADTMGNGKGTDFVKKGAER